MTVRLTALAGVALCAGWIASAAHAEDRTIVVLQALTGVGAFAGAPAAEGMKFAADEMNAANFLGADKLKVSVEDDGSDRGQGVAAVTRLARDKSVLAVLGPTLAPVAIPASSVANEEKMVIMGLTNADAPLKVGPWSFISAQTPEVTMPLLGDYVLNTMKVKSCAMVTLSDNEAYVRLAQVMREYVEPKGVKFVDYTGVKSTDSDFSAIATRVVAAKPDCVFVFTTAAVGANLVIQLKQAGLDPATKLIGHSALSTQQLTKIGGAAVEGIVFSGDWAPSATERSRAFFDRYKKATGKEPDNWVALGYSYMTVMANAVKAAGPNPTRDAVRVALTATKDVPVPVGTGTYSFDANRVPHYGVVMLQVKNGEFVPIK